MCVMFQLSEIGRPSHTLVQDSKTSSEASTRDSKTDSSQQFIAGKRLIVLFFFCYIDITDN